MTAEAGFTNSEAASQITGTTCGWNATAFVSRALSCAPGVFWQQPCDEGISICSHWFFIARQQARSSALICVPGTMQAIAGARHVTSSRTSAPNWRKICIAQMRLRLSGESEQPAIIFDNHIGRFDVLVETNRVKADPWSDSTLFRSVRLAWLCSSSR